MQSITQLEFEQAPEGVKYDGKLLKLVRSNKRGRTAVVSFDEGEDTYEMMVKFADSGELDSFLNMFGEK